MINFRLRGFVRAEALILIVIIGLGLFAVLLAYFSAAALARDRQRLIDVGQISQALQIFAKENGFYPYGTGVQTPDGMGSFLDRWPVAPVADGSCSMLQNEYLYSQKSNGADFILTFCLGGSSSGVASGTHTLSGQGIQ